MPSAKNALSLSSLRLSKGRTAIDLSIGSARQKEKPGDRGNDYAHRNEHGNVATAVAAGRRYTGRCFDSFRRNIESPGQDQRDGKPDEQKHDDQAKSPVWQLPRRKNGRTDLNDKPRGDDVGRRHAINFPPFNLFEETAHRASITPIHPF
jgi:hypothetical protein